MKSMISRNWVFSFYILLLLFGSFSSFASAKPRATFVRGIASNAVSALFKRLWSLKTTNKIGLALPRLSKMKFESGYTVETVFDGSKLGIEPYSVEVSPSGELLVLDSQNSNIHKISTPFSRYSKAKLVAGSSEGYPGHVDGKVKESRMNHPKSLTVDDRGNIYVADTKNMAIRKITDTGVVTIAGGTWGRGSRHIDGPSENAKFSNDFDVLYVASSCSILVVDRGNQAIREIPLPNEDCPLKYYHGNPHLGFVVLFAAAFCGFMLALLERRISAMFSSSDDPNPPNKSIRPPLIPPEDNEREKHEDGFLDSLGKLFTTTSSALVEFLGGLLFSTSKKKPLSNSSTIQTNTYYQPPPYFNTWPTQESFVIPHQHYTTLEPIHPTTRQTSTLTTNKPKKPRHLKQKRSSYSGQNKHFHQQHLQTHYSSGPQTYYEDNNETTNEVVFGAVQEEDQRRHQSMSVQPIDYRTRNYSVQEFRSRFKYHMGHWYDTY